MNIKESSWHYKLFNFYHKYVPTKSNDCFYLRGVVLGILKVLAIAVLAAIIIFGMINWIVLFTTGVLVVGAILPEILAAIILMVGLLAWFALIAFGVYTGFKYLKSKESLVSSINKVSSGISNTYKAINILPIKEGSFIDILRVWIKNKHDKICTTVTFTKD